VKEYVRIRDGGKCQYCCKVVSGANAHVSHVIPVSRTLRLAYDPMNLKLLCYHHHINWWHKHPMEAAEWFAKTFPERWDYLKKAEQECLALGSIKEAELIEWLEEATHLLKKVKEEE